MVWGVACGGRREPAARPRMQVWGSCFFFTWIIPGTSSRSGSQTCGMGPVPASKVLSSSLPATHREVRHSIVVRLEHSGVPEDVIPKCVEPIQRDQEISAGDPFLGKKTGTPSASALGLLHWEIQSPAPRKVGVVLGHRDRLAETNSEDRPRIRGPGSILGLPAAQFGDKAQCLGASVSPCVKCSKVSRSPEGVRRRRVVMSTTGHEA